MNDLTVIQQGEYLFVDSREVAELTEKRHADLLRDIEVYSQYLENVNLRSTTFFILDSYKVDGSYKPYKRYLLTKKGRDMVANKMTGAKGVIFTATYIEKFHMMEC